MDNIPALLGLRRLPSPVERKFPGELEAAVHLVERVASRRKPMGQVVLDNLSPAESDYVRAEVRKRGAAMHSEAYTNNYGMSMLAFCLHGRQLRQVVDLHALSELYRRAGVESAARDIEAARSDKCGDAPVSKWLRSFDWEENGKRGWLTGVLLGYPVWTAVEHHPADGRNSVWDLRTQYVV